VRIKLSVIALLMALAATDARAQAAIGLNGGFGYSFVDAADWLGTGVSNASHLSYVGSGYAIFGRRYGTGVQVGLEAGLHRIMTYDVVIDGTTQRGDASAFRALGFVRFWFDEGVWFGEIGVGAFMFDGFSDPSLNPAIGTVLGDGALPGAALSEHLARHGLDVEARVLPGAGLDPEERLLSHAADVSANLIVMGAYGHSRLRETVLGGMTRHLMLHMTVPVLMSH